MTQEEFLDQIATALNEDRASIAPDTELASLQGWDSTGLLGLVAMLDSELQFQCNIDQLRGCQKVRDLIGLVADRLD